MDTYYDFLRIQPTASAAEVETAIQEQYDRWRRLVTHHDVNVVSQANLALSTLETIRATLADPPRRSAYDAGIGLGSTIGGLADPDAILGVTNAVMTPPASDGVVRGGKSASAQDEAAPETTWLCPKCQQPAETDQRYCSSCGSTISEACPICRTVNHVSRRYCTHCGVDNENASRIARDISTLCYEMNRLASEHASTLEIIRDAEKLHATGAYVGAAAIACMTVVTLGTWIAVNDGLSVGWALLASLVFSIACWSIEVKVADPTASKDFTVYDVANIFAGLAWLGGAITWLWALVVPLVGTVAAAIQWNIRTNLVFFGIRLGTTLEKAIRIGRKKQNAKALAIEARLHRAQFDDRWQRLTSIDPDLRYVAAMPSASHPRPWPDR